MKYTFTQWMALVNRAIDNKCGFYADDLPDVPYYEWYKQNKNPTAAANKAVRMAGGY